MEINSFITLGGQFIVKLTIGFLNPDFAVMKKNKDGESDKRFIEWPFRRILLPLFIRGR
jgi:hypothetical protein